MWLSNGDRLARLVCSCRLFFLKKKIITDAYERGADGRSVDSRTIGDGERHERSKFVATGREKGDQTRIDWCCFVLFYCSRQPVC